MKSHAIVADELPGASDLSHPALPRPDLAPDASGPDARPERSLDALVILNPVAANSGSDEAREAIHAAIEDRDEVIEILETVAGASGRKAVQAAVTRALERGCPRVIAVGGDGTVALTAACLVSRPRHARRAVLAIVPTGTANVLARELGIPLAIGPALTLALEGEQTIELDCIQTADRPVLTQVGIGLDAQMIRHTSRDDQISRGRMAYVTSFLRRAFEHRPMSFELEVDGKVSRARAWQVTVANIGVLGAPPFTWGPGIDPTDGSVDLCVYRASTAMELLTLARRLLTGDHRRDAQTRYLRVARRVTIRSRRPVLVQGDGEILGYTPITLDVEPRALRVLVPRDVEDVPAMLGAPMDRVGSAGSGTAERSTAAAPEAASIHEAVDTMVAQHSRTWLLQGWLRHPMTFLSALDTALYLRINALDWGKPVERGLLAISTVMHYGEGWAIVALVLLAIDFRAGLSVSVEALPVLWATMLTVNFPLKRLFRRRRPFIAYVRARVLGPRPKDFSFPSGHTAAAFAGAFLFGAHVPSGSVIFYALATIVGFSRIYLGVHYPSDVLIGAIVGTLLAGAFLALLRWSIPG